MLKVAASPKKLHILSGLDLGTIEKNIITKDLGIIDVFGSKAEYNAGGKGKISLPHIAFKGKIIYVLGFDNKARWKKALGGQYGCLFIDEINVADMDYVREAAMRCDYLIATLNPDAPDLPIYKEYINHSRPLPQYKNDAPKEINADLIEPEKAGWTHWFFSFDHNAGLTPEKKAKIFENVAPGTKQYKNKIQGLRGRATGLVFNLQSKNIITAKQAAEYIYTQFSIGVDTAYSAISADTFSFIFSGITKCRKKITLAEKVYNNKDLQTPISPSDLPTLMVKFADQCMDMYGFSRNIYIDSADQATITECGKYKRQNGSVYVFNPAWKKTKIADRINLQIGWMAKEEFLIVDTCTHYIGELNKYSWKDGADEPEDGNDHCINADQYSWLPYKEKIGIQKGKSESTNNQT